MSYHYTECGLSYIHLADGYQMEEVDGETYIGVEDVHGLHRLIARHLTEKKSALQGEELRFLRVEMGMSQKSVAEVLGVDTQTLARWEKDQTSIPKAADAVLRMYYLESIEADSKISFFLNLLAESEEVDAIRQLTLKSGKSSWSVAL